MRGKSLVLGLTVLFLLLPFPCMASQHLLINSFQITGAKSTEEFIEVYNPTSDTINLLGWRLSRKTASGSLYNLLTAFPEVSLAPNESLIVAHRDFPGNADFYYSTSTSVAEDNTIILYSDQGKTVVDKVGFGKAGDFEGAPMPNPGVKEVWQRKGGADTDNNLADFELKNETTGISRTVADIFVTELMPNPLGSDTEGEWIELYNPNENEIDLGGYVLTDKIGSPKKFNIPAGQKIPAKGYLVFGASQTKISLNNDGDIVELLGPNGSFVDSSGASYGKAQEGLSYAFDGEKWAWTTVPTPGTQNIIQAAGEDTPLAKLTKATRSSKSKTAAKVTKSASKKTSAPKAVLGETNEGTEDLFAARDPKTTEQDRFLGYVLIAVALGGGLIYTVVVNREKLREVFIKERERYQKSWEKIRSKLPRR